MVYVPFKRSTQNYDGAVSLGVCECILWTWELKQLSNGMSDTTSEQ